MTQFTLISSISCSYFTWACSVFGQDGKDQVRCLYVIEYFRYVLRDTGEAGRLNYIKMDDTKLFTANGDGTLRLFSFETTKQESPVVKKTIKTGINKSLRSGPIKMGHGRN